MGFGRRLDRLVTAMVTREGGGWRVEYVASGRTPEGFRAETLDQATRTVDAAVGTIYRDDPARDDAELQYAIYPALEDTGKVLFDISRSGMGFEARDLMGSGFTLREDTLEELARAAAEQFRDDGMLRWVKAVRDLPVSGSSDLRG